MKTQQLGVADIPLLEALFAPLIDNPFFIKNENFQYVAVNDAMLHLCGVSRRNQLVGKTAWEVFPPEAASRYEIDERQVLSGHPITDRLEMVIAAGLAPVWLLLSQIPVRNHKGRIVGIAGTSRRIDLGRFDNASYARLAKAIQHIRDTFDRPLNLKRLSSVSELSASQLERDFRRLLRASPRRYQQKVRIEHALILLQRNQSIAAIAHSCGFSDHSAFTRRFKELTGISPKRYRDRIVVR